MNIRKMIANKAICDCEQELTALTDIVSERIKSLKPKNDIEATRIVNKEVAIFMRVKGL
jgi:hypothetical protein